MLSRLPLEDTVAISQGNQLYSIQIRSLPLTSEKIQKETGYDPVLLRVQSYLKNDSWPAKPNQDIKPYSLLKDDLTLVEDGIIMWGLRVIIPESLRGRILNVLHNKHAGISCMKSLARIHACCPKMNADIEKRVKNCEKCKRKCGTFVNQFHLTHGFGLLSQWNESV